MNRTGTGRHERHRLIPGWDQDVLRSARVIVVGVGALGTECARLLAQAGVGGLVLCDPDTVSESNLSRGALFRPSDVGRPKAEAAARALSELVPDLDCEPRASGLLSGVGLAELRDASAVVSALDSVAARLALATRCNLVGAPMLDAGTHPWGGEVRFYAPGERCFGCGLSPQQRAVRDDPWSCGSVAAVTEAGASAPVSALVGAWLATTLLRTLFGERPAGGTVRLEPAQGRANVVHEKRDPDCPLHEEARPVVPVDLTAKSPVRDLLALLQPGETALTWASVTGDENPLAASHLLSEAPPDVSLSEAGIAPRELVPVLRHRAPRSVRYLELAPARKDPPVD
ncbi:ThiF family adenylyltransferase [Streptomyces sp. NPDC086182]|uniref:ThiF family adenylyltransferase n=1 Tax=Streptomyces sp. NPDC086182 TaxID=3155058 RepID=UPI00343D34FC